MCDSSDERMAHSQGNLRTATRKNVCQPSPILSLDSIKQSMDMLRSREEEGFHFDFKKMLAAKRGIG